MKTTNILISLAALSIISIIAIISISLFAGCKKTEAGNPSKIPVQTKMMVTVPLLSAGNFAILAGSAVNNTGSSTVSGDMGLNPGTSVSGFPAGILLGSLYLNDSISKTAQLDLTSAYYDAAGRSSADMVTLTGDIGGLTLTPGLYRSTSSLEISSADLTFDAGGNANAVFIIQITSALTTSAGCKVILSGGALASNIFWQVGSSASFGKSSGMKGTVLAMQSITFNQGAILDGRGLTMNGGINLAGNTILMQ